MRNRWPDTTLRLREADSTVLEGWLAAGELAAALLYDAPQIDALDSLPVLNEPLVLVAAPHMAVASHRDPLRLRDAARLPLILPGSHHRIRRSLTLAAQQHGVVLHPVLEVDNAALARAMVRQGLGCAVLSEAAVQEDVARGLLAVRMIDRPRLAATLSVSVPRSRHAEELAHLLRATAMRLVGNGHWHGAIMAAEPEPVPRMAAE